MPVPRSVVHAALARLAVLCNEHIAESVTPYRGFGEVAFLPAQVIQVKFVNTPDEQSLELSRARPSDPPVFPERAVESTASFAQDSDSGRSPV